MSEPAPEPKLQTIGGRLRAERKRLHLTQSQAASLTGFSRRAWIAWEANESSPLVTALADLGAAGADVLYVIAGRRELRAADAPHPLHKMLAAQLIRNQLAQLHGDDRRTLLLDLLADELRG